MLQVKWRSLANKSGEALLPEGSHAFQPIPGWDVLKQHTEYQFAETGPETRKDLLKVVQPMARPESKSFTVFGLWCWVMWALVAPWSPHTRLYLCTVYVHLRAHSLIQQPEMRLLGRKQRLGFVVRALALNPGIQLVHIRFYKFPNPRLGGFLLLVSLEINVFDSLRSKGLNRSATVYYPTIEHT